MDIFEKVKQKLAEQKAEVKPEVKSNRVKKILPKKEPKKTKEPESFLELLELDIDDISFYYRQFTGKKRSHSRGAKTTKNYMVDEIIKVLKQSKN